DAAGRQKIIAGGGGAFLHPTHLRRMETVLSDGFTERKSFPSPQESRRLCWRNLWLAATTPRFGVLTGLLYLLLAWALSVNVADASVPRALGLVVRTALSNPGTVLIAALLFLGLTGFADRRFGRWRWLAGVL